MIAKLREACDKSEPSTVEAFGLVVIEATACEMPVIGSNVGAIRDVIIKGGIWLNPLHLNRP